MAAYISWKEQGEYLYRQINDKKVRETIGFLLNREEAHNQMFRDAFNEVQNPDSHQDCGTTQIL